MASLPHFDFKEVEIKYQLERNNGNVDGLLSTHVNVYNMNDRGTEKKGFKICFHILQIRY